MKKIFLISLIILFSTFAFSFDNNALNILNVAELPSDPMNVNQDLNIHAQVREDTNSIIFYKSMPSPTPAGIQQYAISFTIDDPIAFWGFETYTSDTANDLNVTIYDNNSLGDTPRFVISETVSSELIQTAVASWRKYRFNMKDNSSFIPVQGVKYWAYIQTDAAAANLLIETSDVNSAFDFANLSGNLWTQQTRDGNFTIYQSETEKSFFIENATVIMQFGGDSNSTMSFNPDLNAYSFTKTIDSQGTFDYNIIATKTGSVGDVFSDSIQVIIDHRKFLTVTDITNVTHTINTLDVTLTPTIETSLIEFQVDSNNIVAMDVNYIIHNSLNDGKQYFIFTANQAQRDSNVWVFNPSLTYGTSATFDDPIQKSWNGTNERYNYSFVDTLLSNETKFYRLTYRSPALFNETITNSSIWFKQLQSDIVEINEKNYDVYTVSNFSNIRNELIESIPQLISTEDVAFEFQFTAFTESDTVTLDIGLTNEAGTSDTTQSVTVNTNETRFSVDVNSLEDKQRLLMKTNETTSKTIYITDYALVQKGHFTKRLRITKEGGAPLDVIVLSSASNQYIREGSATEARTTAYDREGDLNKLTIEVFLDTENDVNRVVFKEIELTAGVETFFNFIELIPPIIDLNGTSTEPSPPRTAKVKLTLFDTNGLAVEEQSQFFTFIQWPYFPDDIEFFIIPIGKKVAEFPSGIFRLVTKDPSTILGIKLRIFDEGSSLNSPDFTKIFYKDTDFSCIGLDCGFEWTLDDFKYPDENYFTIAGTLLINTENENTSNPLVHKEIIILVSFRDLETYRIFETFERTDHTYKNTEEIALVLQIRTSDFSNLKKTLQTELHLDNCDASSAGNCLLQSNKYLPIKYLFDSSTGYNYWFFKQLYIDDDGTLIDDGNFYRVRGVITDLESKHQTVDQALLTAKCDTRDTGAFVNNMLSTLNHFLFGCTVPSPAIVTDVNSEKESRLTIDNTRVITPPTYEAFFCLAPDANNLYNIPVNQPLVCATYYTLGENPIDNITFKVLNENSDESITANNEKQFISETIPFDLIAFNDLQLMRKALEKEGNTVDTLAEFFAEGFNNLTAGTINPLVSEAQLLTNTGIITNLGFDVNLNKIFSPTNISGAFFIRVDGLKLINQHDFRNREQVEFVEPRLFRRYANLENIRVRVPKTKITVFASDFKKVVEKEIESPLVINVDPVIQERINKLNLDENQLARFDFIPSRLTFDVVSDLSYNNELNTIRRFISIVILQELSETFGLQSFIDFGNALVEKPFETSTKWLFDNLLLVTIILAIALIVGYIFVAFGNR